MAHCKHREKKRFSDDKKKLSELHIHFQTSYPDKGGILLMDADGITQLGHAFIRNRIPIVLVVPTYCLNQGQLNISLHLNPKQD